MPKMKVALLTGCNDKHYQLSLVSGLVPLGIEVDFIGNDDMLDAARFPNVHYFNFRGDQNPNAPLPTKVCRVLKYYAALLAYAARSSPKVFHIQWLNRFEYLDRTVVNLYYKALGKKLVLTAHNVNAGLRDGKDSLFNRWTLWLMYRLMDQIIVHTERMKEELVRDFGVDPGKVTVIPHGVHDAIPCTGLTRSEARKKLGLEDQERVVLFFGNIRPYKGLERLVLALARLKKAGYPFKLVIAGRVNDTHYWKKIEEVVVREDLVDSILPVTGYVPDDEVEIYLKASDLMALPYTYVFQSGVLFVAYNFGLPVVVTDVGSLREEVIEGVTGLVCKPQDPDDLAEKIATYFRSEMYKNLEENRERIIEYAQQRYSWQRIGEMTLDVYRRAYREKTSGQACNTAI